MGDAMSWPGSATFDPLGIREVCWLVLSAEHLCPKWEIGLVHFVVVRM